MFKEYMPKMFNRRAAKGNSNAIFDVLGDLRGCTIGDIGSGGGFFALRFSEAVGAGGKVFAVDNNMANLAYVKGLAEREGRKNIETVLSRDNEVHLEPGSIDLFFSRNSFHHIPEPDSYFARLLPLLKPRGRIAIIDYVRTSSWTFVNLFGHTASEAHIRSTLERAGYRHIRVAAILKSQSFNIFERADMTA